MRAIHQVQPNPTTGLQPLCGNWGSMDTDWTVVSSEATCDACAAANLLLTSALAGVGKGTPGDEPR